MGQTTRTAGSPLFKITERNQTPCQDEDGCVSADSKIIGTYIHGLFDNPAILKAWLDHIGLSSIIVPSSGGIEVRNRQYDLLAEHFQKHVDLEGILEFITFRE
jgi:adenosylcobyric acid synthase